tara:strand:- start:126 stop:251 length:126 start_codon:yes stop_codon:yes gene_type:complete
MTREVLDPKILLPNHAPAQKRLYARLSDRPWRLQLSTCTLP